MKRMVLYLCLISISHFATGQKHVSFQDTIYMYFDELKKATKKGNYLWGHDLFGPLLIVNPFTRELYSNYSDTAGALQKNGKLFTGFLTDEINIANTSLNWNGRRWAMIMLPLPSSYSDRINLLAHELFHKSQPSLGFPLFNTDNNHLDQKVGRIYLRLELEALNKAVNAKTKTATKLYITDAITFRKFRYSIYPGADSSENNLELNEGLAEYTGLMISNRKKTEAVLHFNQSLRNFLSNPFVRSFAYQTIPVYGYLLQANQKYWNKNITSTTNLTEIFIKAFNVQLTVYQKNYVETIRSKYNGQMIITEETERESIMIKRIAEYKQKFIEQSHLEIKFEKMNVSFDPGNLFPIEDKGTVYPNIRVSDNWGILTVTNGALMSPGWDKIYTTLPTSMVNKIISGNGWTLTLKEGYEIIKESSWNYKMIKH